MYSWDQLSGRRFISLPVPNFCSLTCASRVSPIWLRIDRNDFYACCLRTYLHGPQLCLPSSEKRCTLFLRSFGHLENLLLQKNGENMLLHGICVYNYNQICEVHVMQIKTMTEGYDRPLSTDHSATNNVPEEITNVTVLLLSA